MEETAKATEKAKKEAGRQMKKSKAPWHPHEECPNLTPDATISISSGGICFGYSDDIKTGLAKSPSSIEEAIAAGNDFSSPGCENIKARNGVWNAYRMDERGHIKGKKPYNCAWLFCHSNVDPVRELRYILYHSVEGQLGGGERRTKQSMLVPQYFANLGILKICPHEWGLKGNASYRRFDMMQREGFQFAEHGKAKDINSIYTKLLGGGKSEDRVFLDLGRILFDGNGAYALLAYSQHTVFDGAFFPAMSPKGRIPKFPLKYPYGHHNGNWSKWDNPDEPANKPAVRTVSPSGTLISKIRGNHYAPAKKKHHRWNRNDVSRVGPTMFRTMRNGPDVPHEKENYTSNDPHLNKMLVARRPFKSIAQRIEENL